METRPLSIVTLEKQCINCILENSNLITEMDDNYFVSEIARSLFLTIQRLQTFSIPLTSSNIVSEGNKLNGGINFDLLEKLKSVEYDTKDFAYYYRRLKEEYAKKHVSSDLLKNLSMEFTRKGELDLSAIENIQLEIDYYLSILRGKRTLLYSLPEMMDAYETNIHEREEGKHFYPTGNSALDRRLLQGFYPGWSTALFAATGIGKSVYALNLINGQINLGIPSVYVSLEMDMISTMDRLIALRNRIPIESLYPSSENESLAFVYEVIEKERKVLEANKLFYFVEEPALSMDDLGQIAKEAKKRMGVDYLVMTVDLMTMITDFHDKGDKQSTIYEDAQDKVHRLAKKEKIHIVEVVQANRDTEKVKPANWDEIEKLRPTRNSIKNSNAIAERSRIVIGAFRPKFYANMFLPDDPRTKIEEDILDIDILKQNMGELARVKYLYEGEIARVAELKENKD